MTTTLVKRPARVTPPDVPIEPIVVADPPTEREAPPPGAGIPLIIMPVVGGVGSLVLALANRTNPVMAVVALAALIGSISVGVVVILLQRLGPKRLLREGRERYLDYVDELRRTIRKNITAQRAASAWRHPAPSTISSLVRDHARLWERRRSDPDFLVLRMGVGDQPITTAIRLQAGTGPLHRFDPVCLEAAVTLQRRYSVVHEEPVTVDLAPLGVLSVCGERNAGLRLVDAMTLQLVALQAPPDVRLALVRADHQAERWDWVKWLPHCLADDQMDGDLPARLITSSVGSMVDLLSGEFERRLDLIERTRGSSPDARDHLVVIVDGHGLEDVTGLESPDPHVTLAELGIHVVLVLRDRRQEPESVDERIEVSADLMAIQASRRSPFAVDEPPRGMNELVARLLAPLRISAHDPTSGDSGRMTVGLPQILGVADAATFNPGQTWRRRQLRDLLRIPIGVDENGEIVRLDLKESAHGGMGPHGMIVGATGSGKSELLRTLVSSLVVSHGPDRLALMLADFKGGATFAAMEHLPHLAGMVTNLQDDLTLVDRMRDALGGEIQRRQEYLKRAGNLPNLTAYHDLVDAGRQLEPLPHLLVIIDEFSELLAAKPDFSDLFVAIGRIGRSIGVHLLLATQKLEIGRIRGLESHLSYRISLRTFSEVESRDAIGVPDAYHLPPEPGSGYLKVDTTVFKRFRAGLVSLPYTPPTSGPRQDVPVVPYVAVNGLGGWVAQMNDSARELASTRAAAQASEGASGNRGRSVLDVLCQRLSTSGATRVRPVWLDPLPEVLPLDAVMDVNAPEPPGTVRATLGLVDHPVRQHQFPLEWDFRAGAGNLVVAGAPQTGKSTLLRTLIGSMALRHAPGDVAFYCVDYGGGGLRALEELPHVAGVATRVEPERINRTVSDVVNLLEGREELFREHGLDSMAAMRAARAEGRLPPEVPGDVFLIIDGWGSFREDFEAMEFAIGEVAARGLNFGIHVILTVIQNMQVRMRMQPNFSGHLELRLNDSFDSLVGRKLMESLPADTPGRGLAQLDEGLIFQVAVPRADGGSMSQDLMSGQQGLVELVRARWSTAVQRVRVLPSVVTVGDLPEVHLGDDLLPIGLSDLNLGPAAVTMFGPDPHLLVYGDTESGKTNTLRVLIHQLVASRGSQELAFVVVDYRRSLLDVIPPEYLGAYCSNPQQAGETLVQVSGAIRARLPGPGVSSEQLRNRSWWKGVDVVLVIDDYDLVATSSGNPVQALLDHLAQGRDLGLHVVVARRTGGLSRAVFEPVLQRLNDIQTPGLVLSGDRHEGRLVNGVVARRLPPGRAIYAPRGSAASQIQVALLDGVHGQLGVGQPRT